MLGCLRHIPNLYILIADHDEKVLILVLVCLFVIYATLALINFLPEVQDNQKVQTISSQFSVEVFESPTDVVVDVFTQVKLMSCINT